mgnify:CR=1 FL=1
MAHEPPTDTIPPWLLQGGGDSLCLVVSYADRLPAVHPLPPEAHVRIGRGSDQDVVLRDVTVSRHHADLMVKSPGPFLITNHSRNGTYVGGRLLAAGESESVYLAQPIRLSQNTVAWVQRRDARLAPWQVGRHAQLQEALIGAISRAAAGGQPLALASLLVDHVGDDVVQQVLAQEAMATDVAAAFAPPHEYELLMVDTAAPEAQRRMEGIAARLRAFDAEVRFGISLFPDEATTADELVERASMALRRGPAHPTGRVFITMDGRMGDLYARCRQAASLPPHTCILLLGETGVGKRVVAEELHQRSPRAENPFYAISIAARPETTLESELFGHVKGAFTDAIAARPGLLVAAAGGTVFLDEIGELSLSLQVKLLNVIEERVVRPVGHHGRPVPIDVRFVSATNRDLRAEADAGRFRLDLYYRLAGCQLKIPPLRERVEEIEPLVRFFLQEAARDAGLVEPALSREAIELLRRHRWEGNVRQLRHVIENAVVFCKEGVVRPEDLDLLDEALDAAGPTGPLYAKIENLKRSEVLEKLAANGNNQSATARELGISRVTLGRLLKKLGIHAPRQK